MWLKLISVLLLFGCRIEASNEDYFRRSIFQCLMNEKGQFTSRVNKIVLELNLPSVVLERHSYKLKMNDVTEQFENGEGSRDLYLSPEECYDMRLHRKTCRSMSKKVRNTFLSTFVPSDILDQGYNYTILGK